MTIVIDRHNKAQMHDLLQAANGMRELCQRLNEYNTLDENNLNGSLGEWIQKINAAVAMANPALVSLGMPTIETDIFMEGGGKHTEAEAHEIFDAYAETHDGGSMYGIRSFAKRRYKGSMEIL